MEKDNVKNPLVEDMSILNDAKKKRKAMTIATVIIAAIIIIGFVWYFVNAAASKKADEAIALADTEFTNDSIQLANYKEAAKLGHKSGARAGLQVAIALYNDSLYTEAIDYLKKSSVKSSIVEAGRYSLMGDCYANLDNLDEALSCYNKAIKAADNNPQVVPFVLVKEANIYRAQKKYKAEYEAYERILKDYPSYVQGLQVDIKKYAERAKAAAEIN